MEAFLILLLLGICSTFTEQRNLAIENRIIGGEYAREGQFPFAAAIDIHTPVGTKFCGGSLITDQWILTAAHCLDDGSPVTIHLGSNSLISADPNRISINSSNIVLHPDFNRAARVNDIALIRLPEAVKSTDFIQPIRLLPSMNLPTGWKLTVLGWGSTRTGIDDTSSKLKYVTLSVISNNDCRNIYNPIGVSETTVCLIGSGKEGAYRGDSGGALVIKRIGSSQWEHVGVLSRIEETESTYPSIFSRTFFYVDWIKNVIA